MVHHGNIDVSDAPTYTLCGGVDVGNERHRTSGAVAGAQAWLIIASSSRIDQDAGALRGSQPLSMSAAANVRTGSKSLPSVMESPSRAISLSTTIASSSTQTPQEGNIRRHKEADIASAK